MQQISSTTVYQILDNYFGVFMPADVANLITVVADQDYLTIPTGNWLRDNIIHDPIVSPKKYKKDIFDCDDYVMYIKTRISLYSANTSSINKPLAVGFILTDQHAFNFGITDAREIYLLNTQSSNFASIIPESENQCANFLNLSDNNHIKLLYI